MPHETIDPVSHSHLLSGIYAHLNPDPRGAAARTGTGQAGCDFKNVLNFAMRPS